MKLKKFTIKNYKRIKEASLDFSEGADNITVLAGQNESGKSSLLEALEVFYQEGFSKDSIPLLKEQFANKQFASFTFSTDDQDIDLFCDLLADKYPAEEMFWNSIKEEIKNKKLLKEITFKIDSSTDEENGAFLDNDFIVKIESFINSKYATYIKNNESNVEDSEKILAESSQDSAKFLNDDFDENITSILYKISPQFVLFSDSKCDLLPDNIRLSDFKSGKGDGVNAVKNLGKILNVDFSEIASKNTREQTPIIENHNKELTADFMAVFRQKIHNENSVKISYDIDTLSTSQAEKNKLPTEDIGQDFIYFSVETKDGEPLPLRLRSKGLIWFLSFWLVLKSLKGEKHIILIDEPDNSLHINAQEDLLAVLESVAEKDGHQIVYSTHSPFLIPTNKLDRIKIVYNNADEGVKAKDITAGAITKNQEEALLPIFHAIGCDVSKNNAIFDHNNIIVEGLSDVFVLQAMGILLREKEYHYLPGIGTKGDKLNSLIGLCLGYGLRWCLLMDQDFNQEVEESYPVQKYNLIRDSIFGESDEKTKKFIKVLDSKNIEDVFDIEDIEKISEKTGYKLAPKPKNKDNESYIGKPRKVLFWKLFLSAVKDKKIKEKDISDNAKNNFKQIFKFFNDSLNLAVEEVIVSDK